jgi:hypothetical protein
MTNYGLIGGKRTQIFMIVMIFYDFFYLRCEIANKQRGFERSIPIMLSGPIFRSLVAKKRHDYINNINFKS